MTIPVSPARDADVPTVATRPVVRARPASVRMDGLVTTVTALLVVGVYLVLWADLRGELDDRVFTSWHVPAYTALVGLILVVVLSADRAMRRGHTWRTALPSGYLTVVVGVGILAAYPLVELVSPWSPDAGDGVGGAVRLSGLLIPLGLVLIVMAPLRADVDDPGRSRARTAVRRLPAMLAGGLLLAALWIPVLPLSPLAGVPAAATSPARDATRQQLVANDQWSGVWVESVDRRTTTHLTFGNQAREAIWSPDGQRIAFGEGPDLSLMRPDGSGRVSLASSRGLEAWMSWAPDSSRIAYMLPTQRDLGAVTVASEPPTPAPGGFGPLSPDGLDLGSGPRGQPGDEWDLWVVGIDGSDPVQLTDAAGVEGGPSWSPDGREIVYHSSHLGQSELWIMPAAGGESRRLTDDPAEDLTAAWSPDGSRIAFTSDRGGDYELYSVAIDGSDLRQITNSDGQAWNPSWSPDGRTIAFLCSGPAETDVTEVCTIILSTGLVRQYTDDVRDSIWLSNQAWSADGKTLLWSARRLTPEEQANAAVARGVDDAFDVARLLLATGALVLVVLIAWQRRVQATGLLVAVMVVPLVLTAAVFDELRFVPAVLVAAVATEIAVRELRPWADRSRLVVVAAVLAAAWVVAYLATLAISGDLRWSVQLTVGVALLCTTVGALLIQPVLGRGGTETG